MAPLLKSSYNLLNIKMIIPNHRRWKGQVFARQINQHCYELYVMCLHISKEEK